MLKNRRESRKFWTGLCLLFLLSVSEAAEFSAKSSSSSSTTDTQSLRFQASCRNPQYACESLKEFKEYAKEKDQFKLFVDSETDLRFRSGGFAMAIKKLAAVGIHGAFRVWKKDSRTIALKLMGDQADGTESGKVKGDGKAGSDDGFQIRLDIQDAVFRISSEHDDSEGYDPDPSSDYDDLVPKPKESKGWMSSIWGGIVSSAASVGSYLGNGAVVNIKTEGKQKGISMSAYGELVWSEIQLPEGKKKAWKWSKDVPFSFKIHDTDFSLSGSGGWTVKGIGAVLNSMKGKVANYLIHYLDSSIEAAMPEWLGVMLEKDEKFLLDAKGSIDYTPGEHPRFLFDSDVELRSELANLLETADIDMTALGPEQAEIYNMLAKADGPLMFLDGTLKAMDNKLTIYSQNSAPDSPYVRTIFSEAFNPTYDEDILVPVLRHYNGLARTKALLTAFGLSVKVSKLLRGAVIRRGQAVELMNYDHFQAARVASLTSAMASASLSSKSTSDSLASSGDSDNDGIMRSASDPFPLVGASSLLGPIPEGQKSKSPFPIIVKRAKTVKVLRLVKEKFQKSLRLPRVELLKEQFAPPTVSVGLGLIDSGDEATAPSVKRVASAPQRGLKGTPRIQIDQLSSPKRGGSPLSPTAGASVVKYHELSRSIENVEGTAAFKISGQIEDIYKLLALGEATQKQMNLYLGRYLDKGQDAPHFSSTGAFIVEGSKVYIEGDVKSLALPMQDIEINIKRAAFGPFRTWISRNTLPPFLTHSNARLLTQGTCSIGDGNLEFVNERFFFSAPLSDLVKALRSDSSKEEDESVDSDNSDIDSDEDVEDMDEDEHEAAPAEKEGESGNKSDDPFHLPAALKSAPSADSLSSFKTTQSGSAASRHLITLLMQPSMNKRKVIWGEASLDKLEELLHDNKDKQNTISGIFRLGQGRLHWHGEMKFDVIFSLERLIVQLADPFRPNKLSEKASYLLVFDVPARQWVWKYVSLFCGVLSVFSVTANDNVYLVSREPERTIQLQYPVHTHGVSITRRPSNAKLPTLLYTGKLSCVNFYTQGKSKTLAYRFCLPIEAENSLTASINKLPKPGAKAAAPVPLTAEQEIEDWRNRLLTTSLDSHSRSSGSIEGDLPRHADEKDYDGGDHEEDDDDDDFDEDGSETWHDKR